MKTEQIDVPHFEGFECIGLHIPNGNEHYVLAPDGESLMQLDGYCVQVCYKEIQPKIMTLIHIPLGLAQEGDYVENSMGGLQKIPYTEIECINIWRPI